MSRPVSELEAARLAHEPVVPDILRRAADALVVEEGEPTTAVDDASRIRERFPSTYGRPVVHLAEGAGGGASKGALRVGVVLSGGQAPGGHNVIAGLFDALRHQHPDSRLIGFLGGPRGILEARTRDLSAEVVAAYRNTGGFDLIGSGRDKIETGEQLEAAHATCAKLGLAGLVIVGGDDSNTNAALLAEHFGQRGGDVSVVGVPKTIDGDLKGGQVEISFGFDTATRVYSELVGNICRDARSAGKYWHVIKLMGRSASHVALECALQTHANVTLIGEEVEARGLTLDQIVDHVAGVVRRRAAAGKHHGVCLVPEGLIEFIPEFRSLIAELNALLAGRAAEFGARRDFAARRALVGELLEGQSASVFGGLPPRIQEQLLMDRDSHGNVQVSKIDTEELLKQALERRIAAWRRDGDFPGEFKVQGHFFGYEGRCAAPTLFDSDYTYALGRLAAMLIAFKRTGYLCGLGNLADAPARWVPRGIPLTSLMQVESRKGRPTPVIGKALVRTDAEPFRTFAAERQRWETEDDYRYPGAIQYFGPPQVCRAPSRTLLLERTGAETLPAWLTGGGKR